jgi:hypothetical protein
MQTDPPPANPAKSQTLQLAVAAAEPVLQAIMRMAVEQGETQTVQNRVQALNTEIRKQLRLCQMDLLFLKTARHPTTQQQRCQQLQDRLTLLLQYSQGIVTVLQSETLADMQTDSPPPAGDE